MKFHDLRSKLATRLRPGARYPDPAALASKAQPQSDSALLQLPSEIRNAIFREVWRDAGVSQHVMLQGGRYVLARCVTDHAASDDLMDECAKYRMSNFNDPLISQRLLSPWGNHWKCKELYQSTRQTSTRKTQSSPFLAIMLSCSQLYVAPLLQVNQRWNSLFRYLEYRTSIYHTLTFVIHDVETLYRLAVSRPLPLLNNMKQLQLALRLPIRREEREKMNPSAHAAMARWRKCCSALDQAESLVSVDLWLDTSEPTWRFCLSWVLNGNANPFVFGERLAGILTVDIPVNPERPEAWKDVANIEPRFVIRARGWPPYRAEPDREPHFVRTLMDWEEPGAPVPTIQPRRIAHRRPRHLRSF
ncbi:hypothetical protein B0J13DRAFT_600272 [Dactylonectria estremocensis]|uniref:Uncharacterized protein n=1 Tax=Dactylonectria estremocensis TaxID=1079267 RepID=A0A9P9D414_9HYPO|nr:hypothetical protein B0J13DRAFT_600272 [Dactylonectria estremocensis]